MDYNIRALEGASTFCLVNLDQATAIARIDGKTLSNNLDKFVEANSFSYFVLLNSWGHQIQALASEEAWAYVWIRIQQCGLVSVIRDTSALADLIIHGEAPVWDTTYGYLSILANYDYSVASESLVAVLRCLRYPKRFSPLFADRILADSLNDFIAMNKRNKALNATEPSWFWVQRVRARLADMLKDFSWDISDGYFSSGTTTITKKQLLPKMREYAKQEANLASCPLYHLSSAVYTPERWRGTRRLREAVVVQSVPKSYKAARIIAKEPPVSTFGLQAVAKGILRCIRNNGYEQYVDVSDQTYNQDLSEVASIDGSYATIDLSNASDSITEVFARSVLPGDVLEAIDEYRCAYLEFSGNFAGQRRVSQMFSTSGSPVTFVCESAIFCAIVLEVGDVCARLAHMRIRKPRVYGDDIIVDDRICDTVCEVLQVLGFQPNMAKTFSGTTKLGRYRESCGEEWLNGMPMHHNYYSRASIRCNADGIASLCDLQHRFFDNWKLRLFLVDVVRRLEPRMTAHYVGAVCDDLWDLIPTGKMCTPKELSRLGDEDGSYLTREKYLGLMTRYDVKRLNDADYDLLSMWYYYSYLKYGPLYSDPLSELLRLSVSRCRYTADSSQSESVWAWRVE